MRKNKCLLCYTFGMKKKIALFHFAIAFSLAASAGICDVQLKGMLGKRLDRMIRNHVAGTDVDYITAPFVE